VVIRNILVVCVGNICRSPIAQGLLARRLADRTVWSAGLSALTGQPADAFAVDVAAAAGLDISAHRSQQVSRWMCETAELILVMEQGHRYELEQRFPLVRGKVYRVGEAEQFDIADPFRMPKAAFAAAYQEIESGVSAWVPRILQLDCHVAEQDPFDTSPR
jgi:protein-tyrosine phosphatase